VRPREIAFHSVLADGIARFLAHKRALGRRFRSEERELQLLDHFLHIHAVTRVEHITADLLAAILASRPRRWPRSYNHLLGVVRGLLDWLVGQGILTASPLRATPRRPPPSACRTCSMPRWPAGSWRSPAACPTRPGRHSGGSPTAPSSLWLYGLGLRVGEVARLQRNEVDLERAVAPRARHQVRQSRLVPFGPRLAALLREYLDRTATRRGALLPEAPAFSFRRRRAVRPGTISQTFHHLLPRMALALPVGTAAPRVHDLRHAFAVGTLLRWYRAGINPSDRLLQLSTFLGHVNPTSTAVYLTLTPIDSLSTWRRRRCRRHAHDTARVGSAALCVLRGSSHDAQRLAPGLRPELPHAPAIPCASSRPIAAAGSRASLWPT